MLTIKEKIIKKYFSAWINNDSSYLKEIFDDNIIYIESHGFAYKGIEQIFKWFLDWNKNGKVILWDIKQFVHQDNITVVEWYFKCEYNRNTDKFDGVSIIKFDKSQKIISLKEFQSLHEYKFTYCKMKDS